MSLKFDHLKTANFLIAIVQNAIVRSVSLQIVNLSVNKLLLNHFCWSEWSYASLRMCFKFSGTTKLSFPFVFKTSSNLQFPWSFLRHESSESSSFIGNFWHSTMSKENRKITQTIVKHFRREIESNLSNIFFELWWWKVSIEQISCFNLNRFQ